MRQLFIPACICLASLSGSVGSETLQPPKARIIAPIDHFKFTGERPQPATNGSAHNSQISEVDTTAKIASLQQAAKAEEKSASADIAVRAQPDAAPTSEDESTDQKQASLTPADTANTAADTQNTTADVKATNGQKVEAPMPPAPKRVVHRSTQEICQTLAKAAHTNDVPVPFFIRLLFQESRFKAAAVSHAGAQGIAQFMPDTAASVGLDNPFDPLQAIPAAARLLHDLIDHFGNLGLAAAAYNAGAKRIQDWLSKKGTLPTETIGYVKAVTGRPPQTWKAAEAGHSVTRLPYRAPCKDVAGLYAWNDGKRVPLPSPAPIIHHDIVVAKNNDKHKAHGKEVKPAKTDKTDRTAKVASKNSTPRTTKVAGGKAAAHPRKTAKQTAKKNKDAIQFAARKRRHKAHARPRAKTARR